MGGSRCSLDLLVVCISIRMLTLWVSFVLWCFDPGISHACSCTSFHICFSDADRIFYYGQPTKSPYLLLFYQKKTLFIVFSAWAGTECILPQKYNCQFNCFFFLFSMLMLVKCKKSSLYFCDYAEHKANFKDSSTVNPKKMKVDTNVFKRDLGNI